MRMKFVRIRMRLEMTELPSAGWNTDFQEIIECDVEAIEKQVNERIGQIARALRVAADVCARREGSP